MRDIMVTAAHRHADDNDPGTLPGTAVDAAHAAMLARCRAEIAATLRPLVPAGQPVALVNFPNHRNVGDPAIWLGERAVLDRLDVPVAYTCTPDTFSLRALRRAVGDGTILINGGGNLGDRYAGQQGLRERVLAMCRDNPIVQLPQSISFGEDANRDRVAGLIEAHGAVTVLCRDRTSEAAAREHLRAGHVAFCHDMVLALEPMPRPCAPTTDVVWIARRDPEAAHGPPPPTPGVEVLDWLEPLADEHPWPHGARWAYQVNLALVERMATRTWAADHLWRPLDATFGPLARAWVARGARILARGSVVVADRLHAHVLTLLLGIPSVVLDNDHGKVHGVVDASTAPSPLTHPAHSVDEALALALDLTRAPVGRPDPWTGP